MIVSRTFPNAPASATLARRFVTGELRGIDESVVGSVELIVSELATNSMRHADTQFTVLIDRYHRRIRVDIADGALQIPALRQPVPTQPSGRGLQIVDKLADEWGVVSTPQGKIVWFYIQLAQAIA